MTDHKDFNDDNDDFTTPTEGADAAGAEGREDSLNSDENTATGDASRSDAGRDKLGEADAVDADNAATYLE